MEVKAISYAIRASFAGCSIADRKEFSVSACILPISIINRSEQEGEKFKAIIKLVNRTFKSCTIMLSDSLYRHTLKISNTGLSENELLKKSLDLGQAWLERNKNSYTLLNIPYNVVHWDHYLKHEKFSAMYQKVSFAYQHNLVFREELNHAVKLYLYHCMARNEAVNAANYAEIFNCCVEYLKEESAGFCLWTDNSFEQYAFEIYPTGRGPFLTLVYELFIKWKFPQILRPVSIRFKKYKTDSTLQN